MCASGSDTYQRIAKRAQFREMHQIAKRAQCTNCKKGTIPKVVSNCKKQSQLICFTQGIFTLACTENNCKRIISKLNPFLHIAPVLYIAPFLGIHKCAMQNDSIPFHNTIRTPNRCRFRVNKKIKNGHQCSSAHPFIHRRDT